MSCDWIIHEPYWSFNGYVVFYECLVVNQSGKKRDVYCPGRVAKGEPILDCDLEKSCKLTAEKNLGAIWNMQNE